jgi:hypothetical protein
VADLTRTSDEHPEAAGCAPNGQVGTLVLHRGQEALCLLLEAYHYAQELRRSVWDFAVEIESLRQAGCTNSEFRWLICKGYVDHAPETTMPGEESRAFRRQRRPCGLTFSRKTCFVLTAAGFAFARAAVGGLLALPQGVAEPAPRADPPPVAEVKPKWDRERQELRLGDAVVKQFKVPAANQERILAAFEEDGWPVRIDDPLPPSSDQDSKRRLHDTINSLNRNQKRNLIRFSGDGSGQGVLWQLAEPPVASSGRAANHGHTP